MAKKEIMVLFVGFVLIILIGIGTIGFFFDVGITGNVSVEVRENILQGFDLAIFMIIITIIILVIMNIVLKNLARL